MRVAESKPSMDDALAHYGVKGMKWGQRKSSSQIRAARGRRAREKGKLVRAVNKHESTDYKSKAEKNKAERALAKQRIDFLNNPDRATAARMTAGETALLALFGSPLAAGAAYAGTRARSVHITSKQAAGDYDKKK